MAESRNFSVLMMVFLCAVVSSTALAQKPAPKVSREAHFVEALRQRGYFDYAQLYLDEAEKNRTWIDIHTATGVRSQQVMPTRSYLSQAELPITFGLGDHDQIDKLVIRWPNGTTREVKNPEIDTMLEFTQAVPTATSKGQ